MSRLEHLLIAVGLSFFLDYVRNPPSLVTVYLGHASGHLVNPVDGGEPYEVNTHSVVILNNGRRSASNVRLTPQDPSKFSCFPRRRVSSTGSAWWWTGDSVPLTCSRPTNHCLLSLFPPITWTDIQDSTRSDDGFAKVTRLVPKQQFPRWLKTLRCSFFVLAASACCTCSSICYPDRLPMTSTTAGVLPLEVV